MDAAEIDAADCADTSMLNRRLSSKEICFKTILFIVWHSTQFSLKAAYCFSQNLRDKCKLTIWHVIKIKTTLHNI